ncbi:MAG: SDR family oxidoreductase [Betaproteobacteria bacterium]|nr:MAG: SDR family oxidoreductase [Betaproteobacteria bacterium]
MQQPIRLDGKTALVTGASSGLGWRFAQVLAQAGARIALAARSTDKLELLKGEIEQSGGKACAVRMDVTDVASIRAAVISAESALGGIDILVNNSGVSQQQRAIEVEEKDYDYVTDTNCKGAFFVAQAVGRSMIARKCPGRIVNIASAAGLRVLAQLSTYCMSKAAVIHMTKALANEWGRYNINVNAICPGYIETGINRDFWQSEGGKKVVNMLPRRRVGRPEDLDGIVLLLASEQSGFINGAVISADDGLVAG